MSAKIRTEKIGAVEVEIKETVTVTPDHAFVVQHETIPWDSLEDEPDGGATVDPPGKTAA